VRDLSGILLVDKPEGPTSHDVVAELRRSTGSRRVGHAGTLDPFASGLLLLLLGPATRLSEYFIRAEKGYIAMARLGVSTSTDDREGEVLASSEDWRSLSRAEIEKALGGFQGTLTQVPPAYSAKKVRGQPAHRRIRRGEAVELDAVEVEVHEIRLLAFDPPEVSFYMLCSSGTYVRAVARDLGVQLGMGAHLTSLRRTTIGAFAVESALPPAELRDRDRVAGALLRPAGALAHLPSHDVGKEDLERLNHGQALPLTGDELPEGTPIAILEGGELVAIGCREGNRLRPRKVLARD
jgi:tRNA pseudouridine55 synthase